jgi:membrane protein
VAHGLQYSQQEVTLVLSWNAWWRLIRRAVREYMEDDGANLAAALAFSAFFSLFPLILLLVSLASFVVQPEEARRWVLDNVRVLQFAPDQTSVLVQTVTGIIEARGVGTGLAAVIGVLGLLLGASGVFGTLQTAINRAWDCDQGGNVLKAKLVDFGMVLALVVVLLLSTGLSALLNAIQEGAAGLIGDVAWLWQIIDVLVTTAVIAGIIAVLFRTLPQGGVTWREVWPGALLTAIGWELLRQLFAFYLGHFANYQAIYGTLGGIIALQTWIYLSAQVLLFAAEVSSEYGRELTGVPTTTRQPGSQLNNTSDRTAE